ncbi:MAG: M48 family metalloprotease [bacterium]
MWSLIQANKRKSVLLIFLLAVVLLLLGYSFGFLLDPSMGPVGLVGALIIWTVMMITSVAGGEKLLLAQAGAREVDRAAAPQLFNVVEEMQIASGLPVPPKIYVIDSPVPNAFAVGLNPKRAAVAVTTGLLAKLDRDELQGVIGHELAHISNRDTLFMTLAGVTVGAVVMMADVYFRGMRFRAFTSSRSSSKGNNQGAAIMAIMAIILAILAPILAQLLYFACSRRREYLADACSAQFTRFPEGLANALEKIAGGQPQQPAASRVLAPMYIVSPLAAQSLTSNMLSTHPPIGDRIRVLRGIANNSSLAAYEESFRRLHDHHGVIGTPNLAASIDAPIRAASAPLPETDPARRWRAAQGILQQLDQLIVVSCACGLKIKLPPGFNQPTLTCPKCGATHALPPPAQQD